MLDSVRRTVCFLDSSFKWNTGVLDSRNQKLLEYRNTGFEESSFALNAARRFEFVSVKVSLGSKSGVLDSSFPEPSTRFNEPRFSRLEFHKLLERFLNASLVANSSASFHASNVSPRDRWSARSGAMLIKQFCERPAANRATNNYSRENRGTGVSGVSC